MFILVIALTWLKKNTLKNIISGQLVSNALMTSGTGLVMP